MLALGRWSGNFEGLSGISASVRTGPEEPSRTGHGHPLSCNGTETNALREIIETHVFTATDVNVSTLLCISRRHPRSAMRPLNAALTVEINVKAAMLNNSGR